MKFNTEKIHPETISMVLSALIYNEDMFCIVVFRLFGFKAHCFTDNTRRYFYAVVHDTANNRAWIVFRGTDGKNWFGRMLSWGINLRCKITADGFHSGFWEIALKASKDIAPYIKKVGQVYIASHSQGSGTAVCTIAQICRAMVIDADYMGIRHIQADLTCSPPAVDAKGKKEIDGYMKMGMVSINNWWMPGDLLSKKKGILRGLLNGRDVGNMIELPDMILPKYGVFDPVSHSPVLCLAAYVLHLIRYENTPPKEDLKLIEYVLREKMVVN